MLKHFAVIGNPIAHSRSPEIHGQFAAQFGIAMDYQRLLAPLDDFPAVAAGFFDQGGLGCNVTVPFKTQAAAWVDTLDPSAADAEAVNTITVSATGTRGFNTDGIGLVADLQQNLGLPLAGMEVLMLGAGGAAAGVIGPLLAAGAAQVTIANRTPANAERLAARFLSIRVCTFEDLTGPYDLVINATSIGLSEPAKNFQKQSFSDLLEGSVVRGAHCYDMLYGPAAGFCEFAGSAGARSSSDGLGMLVEQAAAAFTLWLGERPDTGPVIHALRETS